jgi:hypothetical protein
VSAPTRHAIHLGVFGASSGLWLSCSDQGAAPFKGALKGELWVAGLPHSQAADSKTVIQRLEQDGWSTDTDSFRMRRR